jgi:nucleotide-binding universal stress UspA family protein
MTTITSRPVVVGVDGEPGSAGAMRYAVAEARRRGTSLRLVHVVPTYLSIGPAIPLTDLHSVGEEILQKASQTIRDLDRDLDFTTVITHDDRTDGLVRAAEAENAQLVVVGRETRRGLDRLISGTVTAGIAAHAPCDVAVVPSFWVGSDRHHRVVVGVKSRHGSHQLIAEAFAAAAARDASLTVVTAWQLPDPYFDRIEARTHADEWETEGEAVITDITADWRTAYPDVEMHARIVHGSPARVLLDAGTDSDLIVISRRRFALPPYGHLGGVGHDMLRLSDVPVLVVPYAVDPPAIDEELVLEEAGIPVK